MNRWQALALMALFAVASVDCRKPRNWSLSPTVPTGLTLAVPGYPGLYLRVDITIPERYVRERGTGNSEAEWKTPERHKNEGDSPELSLSLVGDKPYENGCSATDNPGAQPLTVQRVRKDLVVTQCGYASEDKQANKLEAVRAYVDVQLPRMPRELAQWYLWCRVLFLQEYEPRDIEDATAICSSIRWQVLDAATPQVPSAQEPSTEGHSQGSDK